GRRRWSSTIAECRTGQPQNAAGRPLRTGLVLHQFLRHRPAMGRAHSFFSHTASSTRFFSSDSASIFFNSLFSRSSSFSRRASLISMCPNCFFHRWKVTSDTFSCRQMSWMLFSPRSASRRMRILSSVVYRLPFIVWSFLTAQTNTSGGPKKRSHVNGAFIDCWPLTDVTIPNSVISIGDYAFWNCFGLTNITIGTNVTSIGITAFYNCYKMTSITIPNSVTNIKNGAFGNWESLTNVTIPNNVTSIGYGAFYNCTSLTSVYFQGNAPTPTNDLSVFANDNNVTAYYLPGTTGWGASFDGLPTALGFLPYPV